MCGISVILTTSSAAISPHAVLEQMNAVQAHRGPDDEGIKILGEGGVSIGLGHRRLSVIDLADGQQPMTNEDGTLWITYNGEIYNHLDLRRQLEARGHRYKTQSDTETILHAFEEWGMDCVKQLRGMFAFVIWDTRRHELFAVRDRMGIKPFYYVADHEKLLCASEIKGILSSGVHPTEMNVDCMPEFLTFGYIAGEKTLFKGVKKLLPGHWLTWKAGNIRTCQYWEIPPQPEFDFKKTEVDYIEEFRSIFDESVTQRLMSDVPLGLFLSGGLDSSAIAATMAQQMSDSIQTFSVGYESSYMSELKYARQLAHYLGTDHHEVVLTPEEFFASIPKLIWHEDEPIRDPSSIALYSVAELAQNHVKVVLAGEGSDELFGGYTRYWATMFNQRWGTIYDRVIPKHIREKWIRETIWKWPLPLTFKKKLSHTFLCHSQRPEEIIFDNFHAILPQRMHETALTKDFYKQVHDCDPYQDSVRLYNSRKSQEELDRLLFTDEKTYLVELLMKQDAMSMAASVESRVPFLDHEMVEFASRVPAGMKLKNRQGKYVVRKATEKMLPASILHREKMGFPVPWSTWIRGPFGNVVRNTLCSEKSNARNIFDPVFVRRLLDDHAQARRDHANVLWTMFNVELWFRVFLDGESQDSLSEELACQVTHKELQKDVPKKTIS